MESLGGYCSASSSEVEAIPPPVEVSTDTTTTTSSDSSFERASTFFNELRVTNIPLPELQRLADTPRQVVRRVRRQPQLEEVDAVQLLPHHGQQFFFSLPKDPTQSLVGLRISHTNCPDLRQWHEEAFTTTRSKGAYKISLLGVQQFARVALAFDDSVKTISHVTERLQMLGEPLGLLKLMTRQNAVHFGMFFSAIRNPNHARCTLFKVIAFLKYWVHRGGKYALQLMRGGEELRGPMAVCMDTLRAFAREAKRMAKSRRSEVLRYEVRLVKGEHLEHVDLVCILQHIRSEMVSTLRAVEAESEVGAPLRRKVLSLLEAAVVYGAKGQSRQVLVDLELDQVQLITLPDAGEGVRHCKLDDEDGCDEWLGKFERGGDARRCVVRVYPSQCLEKRDRARHFDSFSLRSWMAPLLLWYVRALRPQLVLKFEEQYPTLDPPCNLLLHSETGMPIGVRAYASVLRYYAGEALPPEHRWKPTFMNLRRSHATNKYRGWYDSQDPQKPSLENFLTALAGQMNTSPAQLVTHYIASYGDRYLRQQVEFEQDDADFESDLEAEDECEDEPMTQV